jgi:hypothetical protein
MHCVMSRYALLSKTYAIIFLPFFFPSAFGVFVWHSMSCIIVNHRTVSTPVKVGGFCHQQFLVGLLPYGRRSGSIGVARLKTCTLGI